MFLHNPRAYEQGQICIMGLWVKYALVKSSSVSKITPVRSKNWRITVSVYLSSLQLTALLLKKIRLRLHCYTLRVRLSCSDGLIYKWFHTFPPHTSPQRAAAAELYAGDRMDFTRENLSPNSKSASSILQTLSCRFCLLKLSNPSKLVISKKMETKDRFTCTQCWGLFTNGISRQKPARLALPETRPTLFRKI